LDDSCPEKHSASAKRLLRNPGKLVRSLFSMNLVMLAAAVAIALLFPLVVKAALVALALPPVPPISFRGARNNVVA
jgi:hypothetical protein